MKFIPGKVSVLMPSYNNARYLPSAIESVLSQTHRNLELIITDDCSTDDSREIVEAWRRVDDRVIPVFHDSNRGVSAARNSGLAISDGEFIALCDADDLWRPEKITVQIRQLKESRQSGLVHSDAAIMDSDGRVTEERFSTLFHQGEKCSGWVYSDLCLRNFICTSSIMLRRECIEYAKGFDEQLRSLEDWICWLRVSRRYPFSYIDRSLVRYRIHQNCQSRQVSAMAGYRVTVIKVILNESSDIPSSLKSEILYSLGMSYVDLGDVKAAFEAFRNSLRENAFNLRGWVRYGQTLLGSTKKDWTGVWKGRAGA